MQKLWVTVPHCVPLTSGSTWKQTSDCEYFVARSHLLLVEHQMPGRTRLGEIATSNITPHGVMNEKVIEVKLEHSILNVDETVRKLVSSSELISEVVTKFSSILGAPGVKAKHEGRVSEVAKLRNSLELVGRSHTASTVTVCTNFRSTYSIPGGRAGRSIHFAYAFQRHAFDVYLVYLDYLHIQYYRSPLGLRRTLHKKPRSNNGDHPNIIPVKESLGSIRYWRLLPDLAPVDEQDYKLEVEDPFDVDVGPVAKDRKPEVEHLRGEPTLYQISRVAFPYKWIDREGDWTREELAEIELAEAEREGSWWFWQHGPGRKRSRTP